MYLCNGRYIVKGLLGKGGFGTVYLAEDRRLHKKWAIKQIDVMDDAALSAAKAELAVLTQVSHPNIVRITDVFSEDFHIYIVMDHVEGMTLREIITSKKHIPQKLLFNWSVEICDAVSYLHDMKPSVIICDLKESNIIIKPDGHPVLIDFGGASNNTLSGTGRIFGSPGYAAPEQKRGHIDARSDIYALGKILEDMSGHDASPMVKWIIKTCRRSDPAKRFKSAHIIKELLIVSRDMYKIMLLLIAMLFMAVIVFWRIGVVKEKAYTKVKSEQDFSQGVMYLYGSGDTERAEECFAGVDVDTYPEAEIYLEAMDCIRSKGTDTEDMGEIVERLRGLNNDSKETIGEERYIKNAICAATLIRRASENYDDYETAYVALDEAIDACGTDKELEGIKEEALGIKADMLIEEGMNDESIRNKKYEEAISCIQMSYVLNKGQQEEDNSVSDLMDIAALYTSMGEYEKAMDIYEKAETEYPANRNLRIFTHLTLMMQKGCPAEDVIRVWNMTEDIPELKSDRNYEYMKERVIIYE